MSQKDNKEQAASNKQAFVVPHTHWDREWYLPFQEFRHKLVKLIDQLLAILKEQEYYFMLDGQTIVLEDYLEIRPEKKEQLVHFIREGKIAVGPWYLLPDEWLVGQESLIRNLEVAFDISQDFDIPLMPFGYLPDQFGHSQAIPQILSDLTAFSAAFIWRGVGPEITTVPFLWKSHQKSVQELLTIYMPFGYGNAAHLPKEKEELKTEVLQKMAELQPYSPFPVYLLMNGTDHQPPQLEVAESLSEIQLKEADLKLSLLESFVETLQSHLKKSTYSLPVYSGEFRSSARAPLLQDTYSTRMWIKQWDNEIEDLLVHYAEPLNAYLWFYLDIPYPISFLKTAWCWLLKNQPHDSICGCSVDQTHEEMKSRYYWAESIAQTTIDEALTTIQSEKKTAEDSSCLVFNPTNCADIPIYFEFTIPAKIPLQALKTPSGDRLPVQSISAKEELIFEDTLKPLIVKSGLKLLPGRKLMTDYINEVYISEGREPSTCNIRLICDKEPAGDFDLKGMKQKVIDLIDSKKYRRFHVKATRGSQQTYAALAPLTPWAFNPFTLITDQLASPELSHSHEKLIVTKNKITNQFYQVSFNRNGTFGLFDKRTKEKFTKLHTFEDWGDRGDEYTFGRLGPERVKVSSVKRQVTINGPLFCEIQQSMVLKTYKEINSSRDKRIGKAKIPVTTQFRFYRDIPRIDVSTKLTNTAKDHRLRICFDLPYQAQKTLTSTHFGYVERLGKPAGDESYIEEPSGIQPQKRFIRVNNPKKNLGITIINKGLPEIELVDNSKIALTLIRAVGYLSRSDFPERPMHAGPFLATPKAQELNKTYTFKYSLLVHPKSLPIDASADHSEAFGLLPVTVFYDQAISSSSLSQPIIQIENAWIRISSIRMRNNDLLLLLYNFSDESIKTQVNLVPKITNFWEIRIDGTNKAENKIEKNKISLLFQPFEIKLCKLAF
ncbi:MAG: hypothetical protein GF308_08075 [Candidatus Heimdallarchaeota archaeon]|nr:hypothetical protein [Candidatus Heimdallarchaeota archaeon]